MRRARRLLFPLVLLIALLVRIWGIGFGLPYANARPDETEVAGPAVGFLSGDLRPPFFQWPTLFPYSVALVYVATHTLSRPFTGYQTLNEFAESRRQNVAPFLYGSRLLSAALGILTVWWVAAICRRIFDDTVAIVAALFLALSFLHARDSHFGVTDVPMTALVVLAVLAILRWRDTGRLAHAATAGVAAGLASSTKYNGLGVVVPFGVALAQRAFETWPGRSAISRTALAAVIFGAALSAAFFATSPYILIDWTRFLEHVSGVQRAFASGHGMTLGQGWWYYARVVLPAAVGWPIVLAGATGTVILLIGHFRPVAVVLAFPIAYYLFAGRGLTVFARYILPVVPFLCISAAWLTVTAVGSGFSRILSRAPFLRPVLMASAAIAMVAPTARDAILLDRLLATTDNRVIAARALLDLVPAGSLIYQTGERYGHAPLAIEGRRLDAGIAQFDAATGQFRPREPDWIVVQRSSLILYSAVPAGIEKLIAEQYVLAKALPTETSETHARVYDQQDAFYLPLEGLVGLTRPGPGFELYKRREP